MEIVVVLGWGGEVEAGESSLCGSEANDPNGQLICRLITNFDYGLIQDSFDQMWCAVFLRLPGMWRGQLVDAPR